METRRERTVMPQMMAVLMAGIVFGAIAAHAGMVQRRFSLSGVT
jgi:hypothetical protein